MIMNALEYVQQFRLDVENHQYNRQQFIDAFGKEFSEALGKISCLTFEDFRNITKKYFRLFKKIQENATNKPTIGVWNAFYVQYVLKLRKEYFPVKDRQLRDKKGYGAQLHNQ